MSRLLVIIFCLLVFSDISAQRRENKKILDSLKKYDPLVSMLDSLSKPRSFAMLDLGFGNRSFSINNKSLNAMQTENRLVVTPSVSYYHKSGLGMSCAGNLFSDSGTTKFFQWSITPSYEFNSEDVNANVSYTRYFSKEDYTSNTPIENDIYASFLYKKPKIQPGFAVGYSTGEYKEIQIVSAIIPGIGPRTFPDTATTTLKAFTLIGMIEHSFDMYDLIAKEDNLSITPTLMLNAGSSKYITTHKNRFSAINLNRPRGQVRKPLVETSKFKAESIGLNLAVLYSIGIFYFQPQIYFDYYLQATDSKKFTQIFSLNTGITF